MRQCSQELFQIDVLFILCACVQLNIVENVSADISEVFCLQSPGIKVPQSRFFFYHIDLYFIRISTSIVGSVVSLSPFLDVFKKISIVRNNMRKFCVVCFGKIKF
jgi:hypothetical protein